MMTKKAQSMSINTVIIAVLALIVLIVVILILTSKTGQTSKSIDSTRDSFDMSKKCEIPGTPRTCRSSEPACKDLGGYVDRLASCEPLGGICCSV